MAQTNDSILGFPLQFWVGIVITGVLVPLLWRAVGVTWSYWRNRRALLKLLEGIADPEEPCSIFVRDAFIEPNTRLLTMEPSYVSGTGLPTFAEIPNVKELWPLVTGPAVANILNVFGQAGKSRNIQIVNRSRDTGEWNTHVVKIGAQDQRAYDFYSRLEGVLYRMDAKEIYDNVSGAVMQREDGFGYGIILKARNPLKTRGNKGIGLLIGGFGTLGTAAAACYLREHYDELGKKFGRRCFGVVVRASTTGGEQSVERLFQHDRAEPTRIEQLKAYVKRRLGQPE